MAFAENELVPISALQHVLYCERQCGLIHIERVWAENRFTAEGDVLHRNVHREETRRRGGLSSEYSVPLRSLEVGVVGIADVIEYPSDGPPRPVEFKRGRPKQTLIDVVQLCAQALSLEEMTGQAVPFGYLFYGKTRRRERVDFGPTIRSATHDAARRVHELFRSRVTPVMEYEPARCDACSLFDICGPKVAGRRQSASAFLSRQIKSVLRESAP